MDFFWNVGKIENFEETCFEVSDRDRFGFGVKSGDLALKPLTQAIIFLTIPIGIGDITPDNYIDFYARLLLHLHIKIEDIPITLADVKAHIGLHTTAETVPLDVWFRQNQKPSERLWGNADELRRVLDGAVIRDNGFGWPGSANVCTRADDVLHLAVLVLEQGVRLREPILSAAAQGDGSGEIVQKIFSDLAVLRQRLRGLAKEIGCIEGSIQNLSETIQAESENVTRVAAERARARIMADGAAKRGS